MNILIHLTLIRYNHQQYLIKHGITQIIKQLDSTRIVHTKFHIRFHKARPHPTVQVLTPRCQAAGLMGIRRRFALISAKVVFSLSFLQQFHSVRWQMEPYKIFHFQYRKRDSEYLYVQLYVDLEYLQINFDYGQFSFMTDCFYS